MLNSPLRGVRLNGLLALLASLVGCGPVGATSLINDAEVAVARAHTSDGERLAIYETTAADLYLTKAREAQGHARYSDAVLLAKKSVDFAEAAARKAKLARSGASTPAAPSATIAHPPAKGSPAAGATTPPASPPIPAPPTPGERR